ncbi:response regulator [Methylobacterium dankookense]|uniref:histidine kinase n=1 Tax=Methylobacterium dankookense TaxID=560405 RepID=A0A564FU28_9HYPH|nr:response regulator [Methylobacterium dankookense]GJD57497.1 Regulator of RpoS [Methylobacterium dankookense]VUF11645.1 Sensor kinase CckA [Methylobacterium dankookense]
MSGRDAGAAAPIRILLIEDSDLDAELIAAALEDAGLDCRIDRVMTREAFAAAVAEPCHDLILADYVLPTFDGLAALDHARGHCPDIPFVFVSGTLGEDVAVEALKTGATDYVVKQRLDRLPRTVLRALAEAQARSERRASAEALRSLNESLEARVAARTAELAEANAELRREIIERQRIEEALRQAQRLEAVGQLTSGIAHDFNNLLTVIAGNLEFLGRAVPDERSRRRIDTMRAAADRGARLTAQLLAFSRRQRLEPVPVRLNDTVAAMRDLLQSSIGGAVEIAMVLEPGLWPALADPTQIELIILNLAINARDAMAVGGRLTIETANAILGEPDRPEAPPAGEHVTIAISDTGSGIHPEVLKRVFEPFFTTKEVGKGSGLGLAQVYGFAKQSGGGVRIETCLGEGTTVRVFLPRAAVEPGAVVGEESEAHPPRPQGERPVVLVVDDDEAVREITVTRLSEAGYQIHEAGSGSAALRVLAEGTDIDLVVLDFAMPGMNGAEAACEIRRHRPALPVIFATGYADRTALMQVESVCEDRIVQKPFRGTELERKVAAALSERPALRLVVARSVGV